MIWVKKLYGVEEMPNGSDVEIGDVVRIEVNGVEVK